jgi:N4-gp56 family major capsid protein
MAGPTLFGDISPRTAGYVVRELLERGFPYLVFEKWGQSKPLPGRSTMTMIFRRYLALDSTPNTLQEGVTPKTKQLKKVDLQVTLQQYGDGLTTTDIVEDTHEDPVLSEMQDVLSEQAAIMIEKVRFNVVKAGTTVFYANGTTRSAVNTKITTSLQRRVTRFLKRKFARKVTKIIRSTAAFGTVNVDGAFMCAVHSDAEGDVRDMFGFKAREDYGSLPAMENEIGKVEDVRYVESQIIEPWADAGGTAGGAVLSTLGTSADVYPALYFARDAYAITALKGQFAITPMVVNRKPSDSDPWAQRTHVTWKTMQGAIILNDEWMGRSEIAVSA